MGERLLRRRLNKLKGVEISILVKNITKIFLILFLVIILAGTIFSVFVFRNKYSFEKPINTAIVYKDNISILRSDPYYDELIKLHINGNVTVDSSGGLGSYPLKNIYTLSENEKSGEDMLKRTLMKNFHIPVYNVIDCRNVLSGNRSLINIIFTCTSAKDFDDTLYLISTRWKMGSKVIEKNIDDYGVVIKDESEEGIIRINDNVFEKLVLDFSQNMDPEEIINVSLVTSDKSKIPLYLYDVVKLVGGRIVEETHGEMTGFDVKMCKISGTDQVFVKNIAMIFGCDRDYSGSGSETTLYFSDDYLKTL